MRCHFKFIRLAKMGETYVLSTVNFCVSSFFFFLRCALNKRIFVIRFSLACHPPTPLLSVASSHPGSGEALPQGRPVHSSSEASWPTFPLLPCQQFHARNLLSHPAGLLFPIFLHRSKVTSNEGLRRPICLRVPKDKCLSQVPFKKKDS